MKTYINFFKNKKIIITGHTGFKGSWLAEVLAIFGAKLIGVSAYKLEGQSFYKIMNTKNKMLKEYFVDINNLNQLKKIFLKEKPDIIFHLAAQSIVSKSILYPVNTFNTNSIGTLNLLEALRYINKKCCAVIITSDKCYLNTETKIGYKETDRLGGIDPYSASKAAAEIIFYSYFNTFFDNKKNITLATSRAGNVIGGGDFSKDRIVPDLIKSIKENKILILRMPNATRPWQHVLEPIRGYLDLSISLYNNKNSGESFNFGPKENTIKKVIDLVDGISTYFDFNKIKIDNANLQFKESSLLSLNCYKAKNKLNWKPKLTFNHTVKMTSEWYQKFLSKLDINQFTIDQIVNYFNGR